MRYGEDFCCGGVYHKRLASVKGHLASVQIVEGLSSSLVGVTKVIKSPAEIFIWNLESGQCARKVHLDPDLHPRVGLLKCKFQADKLVIVLRAGLKIVMYVLAKGCDKLIFVKMFSIGRIFGKYSDAIGECFIKDDIFRYNHPNLFCEWNIQSGNIIKIKRIKNLTVFVSPNEVITNVNGKLLIIPN